MSLRVITPSNALTTVSYFPLPQVKWNTSD